LPTFPPEFLVGLNGKNGGETMRKAFSIILASGFLVAGNTVLADVVNDWDMSLTEPNATSQEVAAATGVPYEFDAFNYIEPGSLVDPNTGDVASEGFMPSGWAKYSVGKTTIFTDSTRVAENGAMTWKERDTQGPGLSVVTGDDVKGTNCIMSAGWNPDSTPDAMEMSDWWGVDLKQCSDPFQSSKRFKLVSYVIDGPVDLTFDVSSNGKTDVYRLLQKYGNHTGSRVTGFTMELGHIVAGSFIAAQPGDGIAFSDKKGRIYSDESPTPSTSNNQGDLDSLMAHGLFGAPDIHHPTPGYFNPYERAGFGLLAGETRIVTTGMSTVHSDLFGEWLPGDQMKGGIYFDDDSNPYTDNILMASCPGNFDEEAGLTGVVTAECDQACVDNLGCDATWETYRESADVNMNPDGTYNIPDPVGTDIRAPLPVTAAQISAWTADPDWNPGDIDDLANVNINAFIAVRDSGSWPTSDGLGNASFTIRVTPVFDLSEARTEPGTSSADQFVVVVD